MSPVWSMNSGWQGSAAPVGDGVNRSARHAQLVTQIVSDGGHLVGFSSSEDHGARVDPIALVAAELAVIVSHELVGIRSPSWGIVA